jgi:hypothetical protein
VHVNKQQDLQSALERTFTDQLPTLHAVREVHTVLTSECSTMHHADPHSLKNDEMLKHKFGVSADELIMFTNDP